MLALVPSLIVLFLTFFSDKYEKEPLYKLFSFFVWGAGLSIPITLLYSIFPGLSEIRFENPMGDILFQSFILAAFVEESLKLLIVLRVVKKSSYFNEPYDGLVYYVMIAAGFAVYEDFTYILFGTANSYFAGTTLGDFSAFYSDSIRMAIARTFPAHVFFGAISGYFIGMQKFVRHSKNSVYVLLALLTGILTHGLFNTIAAVSGSKVFLSLWAYLFGLLILKRALFNPQERGYKNRIRNFYLVQVGR